MKRIKIIKIVVMFLSLQLLIPIHLKAATESDGYLKAKENVLGATERDLKYDVNEDGDTDVFDVVRIKHELLSLSERVSATETAVESLKERVDNIEKNGSKKQEPTNLFDGLTYENGYYCNLGYVIPNLTYHNAEVLVESGDVLRWSYEDHALDGQNGVFFNDDSFVVAFQKTQTFYPEYIEVTVPDNVNKAIINFKNADTFVIVKNMDYSAGEKYEIPVTPELDITNDLLNVQSNGTPYASIFRNVCCIGDSITQGEYGADGNIKYGIYADYCWPSFLAKLINADVQNLAMGGQSAKSWYELYDQTFSEEQKDWTRYDAFILFFGTNGGVDGNYDSTEDSMMGYYCRIIEMILEKNPQASIFLCTSGWTINRDNRPNFTSQIIGLGEHYSLPVLRLDQSEILTYEERDINQPYDKLLHYGRVGYMRIASEIVRCINEIGESNPSYFNKLYGEARQSFTLK